MSLPLDPDLAGLLPHASDEDLASLFEMDPNAARAIFAEILVGKPKTEVRAIDTEDVEIDAENGLRARIYRPIGGHSEATIIFLHGGGYMLGGIDEMDGEARLLCELSRGVILAVDYRLAPEFPLPAAHDDAVLAVRWARNNIDRLGGDLARLGVSGESAGANLAASVAIAMRDEGVDIAAQLLIVPAPDFEALRALKDSHPPHPMLTARDVRAIAAVALPTDPAVASLFPFSAAHAESLSGLAPAVIGLAGHCPTHSIGEAYADRLREAGTIVHVHDFPSLFHPFFAFTAASYAARAAAEELCSDFARVIDLAAEPTGKNGWTNRDVAEADQKFSHRPIKG